MPATDTAAPARPESMLRDLQTASDEHGHGVRAFMLGALSALLADLEGGPEAWQAALTSARECAEKYPPLPL